VTASGRDVVAYRRSRFATRLPRDRRYTAAHYWLLEEAPSVWRVGFTKFATRMLGDLVECEFSVSEGAAVEVGDEIGSVEGFKAITVIYSVAQGEFLGASGELRADITAVEADPYGRGWLYRVHGQPDPESVDVDGYMSILDATIDKLIESRHDAGEQNDDEG
jgi:glycine cleavage system H protein